MKSISRKYNVLLVVVSIICIVLLFTGTSTIKVSKTSLTNTDSEISQVFKLVLAFLLAETALESELR